MPKSKHISSIPDAIFVQEKEQPQEGCDIKQAGFWELDTESGIMCWSLIARAIFNVTDNYEPTLLKLLSFCNKEAEKKILNNAIADCIAYGTPFEEEFEMKNHQGLGQRVHIRGKAVKSQGKIKRIYGSMHIIEREQHIAAESGVWHRTDILEALPDILMELDAEGKVLVYHSPKNMQLVPEREALVGNNIANVLEQGNGIVATVKKCMHLRQIGRYEFTVTQEGKASVYEARVLPVGKERAILLIRDITDSEQEEKELIQHEQKYARLIENMNIGLIEVDDSETITRAHNAFCKMTGYTEKELQGMKTTALFLAPQKKIIRERPETFETRLQKKTGEILDVLVSGAPLYNHRGKIIGSVSIVYDITIQKRTSKLLEESARIANVGVFEIDLIQKKILWNKEMHLLFETEETYQPTLDEAIKFTIEGANRKKASELIISMQKQRMGCDDVFELQTKKGNRKWARIVASSDFSDHGVSRILGIAVDVTKTVEYEKALKAHSDLSDTILSSIQDGFYVVDEDNTIEFINESGAAYIGKPIADLVGKNIWQAFPEGINLFHDVFEKVKQTKQAEQITHHLRIGESGTWFQMKFYPTRKGGVSVFYRDVTKEKEAEESIRNLNDRYNAISAATNQIIYEWNFATNQIEFNDVYYHLTGYDNT